MSKQEWLQVRCAASEKERWMRLADARGVKLSALVRGLLNTMAEREEKDRGQQQRLGE